MIVVPAMLLLAASGSGCPAFTTPTARGVIGETQVKVTPSDKGDGYTCQFSSAEFELTIEVSPLVPSAFADFAKGVCQGGRDTAPVKGIGNEALACAGVSEQRLASRVRNQAFLVRLVGKAKSPDLAALRQKCLDVGEQVAGNLF